MQILYTDQLLTCSFLYIWQLVIKENDDDDDDDMRNKYYCCKVQ